jgi:hypothetical protein
MASGALPSTAKWNNVFSIFFLEEKKREKKKKVRKKRKRKESM